MKLEPKKGALPKDNRKKLDEYFATFGKDTRYTPLLQLLADVADLAAEGADCYCTFGAARDKQSLLMTIHQDGARAYVGGFDLLGIVAEAEKLL